MSSLYLLEEESVRAVEIPRYGFRFSGNAPFFFEKYEPEGAWVKYSDHQERIAKAEQQRDVYKHADGVKGKQLLEYADEVQKRGEQLQAQREEIERLRAQLLENNRITDVALAQRDAALAISNTPEWFDMPCARAIRAALEVK